MPRINVLPKNIADLIAAGEVVERPSSVIKEFVENSIDAGAKKITVEIQNGGKTYMRVTDDGCGIERDDVKKAFISHATSKISSVSDLDAIATLGFRGEALASVCAVSKVELMTATTESQSGTRYIIEGGEEKLIDDVGSPVGTTIVVRDLFYNIPARLKFLKKDVQEGNYIASILEKIALSNPGIAFKFIRDGKVSFQTPGDNNLKSAVYAVFGKEFTSQLIPAECDMNGVKVSGFVTKPTAGRGSRSMQTFFVNGRYVKSVVFMSALEAAYKNSIMVGKYPACVLFVELPFEAVDVNVHPAKTEVRFFEEKKVFDCVHYGALNALQNDTSRVRAVISEAKFFTKPADKGEQLKIAELTPAVDTSPKFKLQSQPQAKPQQSFLVKEYGSPVTSKTNELHSSFGEEPKQLDLIEAEYLKPKTATIQINVTEDKPQEIIKEKNDNQLLENENVADVKSAFTEKKQLNTQNTGIFKPPQNDVENVSKVNFKYIGEAFNTYLIAELEGKLVLIDKHAAHERILFEKFKSESNTQSQIMLQPVMVDLSTEEYAAVLDEENSVLLENAGYDISDFGNRCVKVSACPPELIGDDIAGAVTEIAGYLANNIKTLLPEKLDWVYHSMACRAAIKAGNFTSSFEAEKFVEILLSRDDIRYCPHGRPVLIELTQKELEKQFKRIV